MKKSRLVGIDFGLKRIGIALSDERKVIASPFKIFHADRKLTDTASNIVKELQAHADSNKYEIEKIITGLPLMMNGTKGFLADEVFHFIEELKKYTSIPIITWDERLTSAQAERSLKEFDLSRKKRSKVVDTV